MIKEYPKSVYANVLLLDGKIECWKTGMTQADPQFWPFKFRIKPERLEIIKHTDSDYFYHAMGDYEIQSKEWIVTNDYELSDVFQMYAPDWYTQWEHADDYKDGRAY